MSNESSLRDTVREFVRERFPLARELQLQDDESLVDSGAIDSMGVLEIVTFVEERFGLILSDDDIVSDTFQSIASLSDFVEAEVLARSAASQGN